MEVTKLWNTPCPSVSSKIPSDISLIWMIVKGQLAASSFCKGFISYWLMCRENTKAGNHCFTSGIDRLSGVDLSHSNWTDRAFLAILETIYRFLFILVFLIIKSRCLQVLSVGQLAWLECARHIECFDCGDAERRKFACVKWFHDCVTRADNLQCTCASCHCECKQNRTEQQQRPFCRFALKWP